MVRPIAPYSFPAIVSRAIRARALICLFQGERLSRKAPMLKRALIATGSPASRAMHPADAIAPHCWRSARFPPLRFDLARHLDAWCIGQCMGLISNFFPRPQAKASSIA